MPGPLGVGFGCYLALPDALYRRTCLTSSRSPLRFSSRGEHRGLRPLVSDSKPFDAARRRCGSLPVTMHGVSLSVGSAHGIYEPCPPMMDRLQSGGFIGTASILTSRQR
jgi:hypothetical protein